MKFRPLVLALFVCLAVIASAQQNPPSPIYSIRSDTPSRAHPGRVIVKYRAEQRPRTVPTPNPQVEVARLRNNPAVQYAELDYQVRADQTNDPLYSQQWALPKIFAPQAWTTQTSAPTVVVAVFDTGIDFTHPDLTGNLYGGYTCFNGTCSVGGQDDNGHGTHVAGIIGAVGNNGLGVAGINWQVQLLAMKFLTADGWGYTSDAVLALQKLAELKRSGTNIRVANHSWGGGEYSQALRDALAEVENLGVVSVGSAGNSGGNSDAYPLYPAAYDNRGMISVLASDMGDLAAEFSNFGLANVDIAAPGTDILSTARVGTCALCGVDGYKKLSGTSMAAPHVSGALALLLYRYPHLTAVQARDRILHPGSYDLLSLAGSSPYGQMNARARWTTTGGRLNLYKLLNNTNVPPNTFPTLSLPADTTAQPGTTVTVTAQGQDADGDPLRFDFGVSGSEFSNFPFVLNHGLRGWAHWQLFPTPTGQTLSFVAPSLYSPTLAKYNVSLADGRGGGVTGSTVITLPSAGISEKKITGALVVPSQVPANTAFTATYVPTVPSGKPYATAVWLSGRGDASLNCCYQVTQFHFTLAEGSYRLSVEAMDTELQTSERQTAVIRVGNATGSPPLGFVNLDKTIGVAPLTVNVNNSGSYDPDGGPVNTWFTAEGCSAVNTMSCTFQKPGIYVIRAYTTDSQNYVDWIWKYVTVLGSTGSPPPPSPPPPTQPPPCKPRGKSGQCK